jgi:hypothetical protein
MRKCLIALNSDGLRSTHPNFLPKLGRNFGTFTGRQGSMDTDALYSTAIFPVR